MAYPLIRRIRRRVGKIASYLRSFPHREPTSSSRRLPSKRGVGLAFCMHAHTDGGEQICRCLLFPWDVARDVLLCRTAQLYQIAFQVFCPA